MVPPIFGLMYVDNSNFDGRLGDFSGYGERRCGALLHNTLQHVVTYSLAEGVLRTEHAAVQRYRLSNYVTVCCNKKPHGGRRRLVYVDNLNFDGRLVDFSGRGERQLCALLHNTLQHVVTNLFVGGVLRTERAPLCVAPFNFRYIML